MYALTQLLKAQEGYAEEKVSCLVVRLGTSEICIGGNVSYVSGIWKPEAAASDIPKILKS